LFLLSGFLICQADLFLYSYESEFLQKLVKDKKIHEARAFNFTYRYIDGVLSINNSRFAEFLPLIYPPDLEVVNTICRRSSYIAAHIWKVYDFKIEVVPFIINFSTELTTVVKSRYKSKNDADEAVSVVSFISSSGGYISGRNSANLELLIDKTPSIYLYVKLKALAS
jgi:hypothetical protein